MFGRFLTIVLFALGSSASSRAEIIDRIAVTVGSNVITESMILSEIQLSAFQDGREPDLSPAAKRQAAERLVDRMLLVQEMDEARYPVPPMADILEQIAQFRKSRFPTEDAFRQELARRGIDENELREFFQLQTRALQFIEVRFRTGVQVSSEEVASYFNQEIKPKLLAQNQAVPSLEDLAVDIERILVNQRVDQAMEDWLKQTRSLARIRFREEVFR
ncbi:MAG: hypothetical protein NZV14_11870 [Bryobacteraceae bacterium]|nr:hypothetical protein [Bryobacteraceae bacterium]MDW8378851.1 hypothetical protein [Bryobacterales bacterium]